MRRDSPIRAVLFDWDGTLLDSFHADAHAYQKMFGALGVSWSARDFERHYSPDWYRVYRAVGIPRARWGEADRLWHHYYKQHRPALMAGAQRVLRILARRYVLALVTSGNRTRVARQLREFGLDGIFAARICSEDADRRKPHPAPLREALRRLRLRPEECLYVGDAPEDIQMARRAHVRAVAVLSPFSTRAKLRAARPAAVLSSIKALPTFLGVRVKRG